MRQQYRTHANAYPCSFFSDSNSSFSCFPRRTCPILSGSETPNWKKVKNGLYNYKQQTRDWQVILLLTSSSCRMVTENSINLLISVHESRKTASAKLALQSPLTILCSIITLYQLYACICKFKINFSTVKQAYNLHFTKHILLLDICCLS